MMQFFFNLLCGRALTKENQDYWAGLVKGQSQQTTRERHMPLFMVLRLSSRGVLGWVRPWPTLATPI